MTDAGFRTLVGRGLVEVISERLPPYAAFIAPEPFALVESRLARRPAQTVVAGNMDQDALETLAAETSAAGVEAVVGIGGGSAVDTAKFVAFRTGLSLWQLPSIASVDAVFTKPAGVRIDRRVRYLGEAIPELVAVDLDLVLDAPPALNRAGAGDVLSCHTGLADWRLAAASGSDVPALDPQLVAKAKRWLRELDAQASQVAEAGEAGVRFLVSTLREVGTTCDAVGYSFFEEGSEHYFAYCFEFMTGRRLVHGELVALGIVAMSIAQDNDWEPVVELLERLRVRFRPADLGIDRATFAEVLEALPAFCLQEGFPASAAGVLDLERRRAILAELS